MIFKTPWRPFFLDVSYNWFFNHGALYQHRSDFFSANAQMSGGAYQSPRCVIGESGRTSSIVNSSENFSEF